MYVHKLTAINRSNSRAKNITPGPVTRPRHMPVTRRAARCCSVGRGSLGGAGLLRGRVPGSNPNLVASLLPVRIAVDPSPAAGAGAAGAAEARGSERHICIGSERRRWSVAIRSALGGGIVGGGATPATPAAPPAAPRDGRRGGEGERHWRGGGGGASWGKERILGWERERSSGGAAVGAREGREGARAKIRAVSATSAAPSAAPASASAPVAAARMLRAWRILSLSPLGTSPPRMHKASEEHPGMSTPPKPLGTCSGLAMLSSAATNSAW